MCDDEKQYERFCKGQFASIHAKLDRLDEAVRGNGRDGINVRLDRLETKVRNRTRLNWLVIGAVVVLAVQRAWELAAELIEAGT